MSPPMDTNELRAFKLLILMVLAIVAMICGTVAWTSWLQREARVSERQLENQNEATRPLKLWEKEKVK